MHGLSHYKPVITWKQRATWYATHEAACSKDFLCEEGSCEAKPHEFSLHMVLCGEHIAQNQGAIDRFKSTHQKYSNIALYQLSSNLKKPVDHDLAKEREREGEGGGEQGGKLIVSPTYATKLPSPWRW